MVNNIINNGDERVQSCSAPLRVNIIAAVAENGAIGWRNRLPWQLPADLRHFKEVTLGHPVIMGRHTWESLGGSPLPGRQNIVVSRSLCGMGGAPGDAGMRCGSGSRSVSVVPSLAAALDVCSGLADKALSESAAIGGSYFEVFVIGGAMLYRAALPIARRMILTLVEQSPSKADTFFPKWNLSEWREIKKEKHEGFSFVEYLR